MVFVNPSTMLRVYPSARGNALPCNASTDIAIVEVGIPGKHGCNRIPGLPKSI